MNAQSLSDLSVPRVGGIRAARRLRSNRRSAWRGIWIVGEILRAAGHFGWVWLKFGGRPSLNARARCLQASCRRVLRVFSPEVRIAGIALHRGLLVANHLSYLDILALGAATPCVFVSKSEVRRWPVFGWFASFAGTLFVQRNHRADVSRMTAAIREALHEEVVVVLFPEGTSSGGATVLPFKSALLGAIEATDHHVTPAALSYMLGDGNAADEACYWKDMTLVPHLWNLLGKHSLRIAVVFGPSRKIGNDDRKAIANQLHAEVLRLKRTLDSKLSS